MWCKQYWPNAGAALPSNAAAAPPLDFLMVASADHRAPAAGLAPVVMLSKNGQPFALAAGAVSELGHGWYRVAGNAQDSAVGGPLVIHADPNAAGVDPFDGLRFIVPSPGGGTYFQGNTAFAFPFLMVAANDHVSGLPGLAPSVLLGKPGASFATPTGAVSEIGGAGAGKGWYRLLPTAADVGVSGPLILHAEATGADPTDTLFDLGPTGAQSSARLSQILLAIEGQIVGSGLYARNQVFASLDADPWPIAGTPAFCAVRPGSHESIRGLWIGGGDAIKGMRGAITVRVGAGRVGDAAGRDQYALLNAGTGLLDVAQSLVAVLNGTFPTSPAGGQLTIEPLNCTRFQEPRAAREKGWRALDVVFDCSWLMSGLLTP